MTAALIFGALGWVGAVVFGLLWKATRSETLVHKNRAEHLLRDFDKQRAHHDQERGALGEEVNRLERALTSLRADVAFSLEQVGACREPGSAHAVLQRVLQPHITRPIDHPGAASGRRSSEEPTAELRKPRPTK